MYYKNIFQAIKSHDFESVKEFTEKRNINKNALNKSGYSIIEIAFYNFAEDYNVIKYLLDNKYPINWESNHIKGIVFNIIKSDNIKLLLLFIQHNLPLNILSNKNYSLLEYAFFYNSKNCLKELQKYIKIEEDPFLMIDRNQRFDLISFIDKNKDYDFYSKKGHYTLLEKSLISRKHKIFIYLLKNHYIKNPALSLKLFKDNSQLLSIITQYNNKALLLSLFKYFKNYLTTYLKKILLENSIRQHNLENTKLIYGFLNDKDKESIIKSSLGYELYYKIDNIPITEFLYNQFYQENLIKNKAFKAIHPSVFYMKKYNKKKYDYFLNKFPDLTIFDSKEYSRLMFYSFKNCNYELTNKLTNNFKKLDCSFYEHFHSSKKSKNIKYKFYKKLKENELLKQRITLNKIDISFELYNLYKGDLEFFSKVVEDNNDFLIQDNNDYYPKYYIIAFFLNLSRLLNQKNFYKEADIIIDCFYKTVDKLNINLSKTYINKNFISFITYNFGRSFFNKGIENIYGQKIINIFKELKTDNYYSQDNNINKYIFSKLELKEIITNNDCKKEEEKKVIMNKRRL